MSDPDLNSLMEEINFDTPKRKSSDEGSIFQDPDK